MRAYVGDVVGLLDHLARLGGTRGRRPRPRDAARLARDPAQPRARAHDARPARGFAAHVHRLGAPHRPRPDRRRRVAREPARAPHAARRARRRRGRARDAGARANRGHPLGRRDRAVLELLYATGVRVSELVGLDLDDVDRSRRVIRVLGKGNKQRTVPYGLAAERALDDWLARGRPGLRRRRQRRRRLPRRTRAPRRPARRPRGRPPRRGRGRRARRTSGRTACGTAPPRTCSKAAPTCASSRSCSATPASRRPSSTRTSRSSGCAGPTPRPTPAPERASLPRPDPPAASTEFPRAGAPAPPVHRRRRTIAPTDPRAGAARPRRRRTTRAGGHRPDADRRAGAHEARAASAPLRVVGGRPRQQPHRAEAAQQRHRVEIDVASLRRPVQAAARGARPVATVHRADRVASGHRRRPACTGDVERLVLGREAVRVRDHDDTAPGDPPGEADRRRRPPRRRSGRSTSRGRRRGDPGRTATPAGRTAAPHSPATPVPRR